MFTDYRVINWVYRFNFHMFYFLLTIYIAYKLNNPPIIMLTVNVSFKNILAVTIAIKGTEKIKTLALDGPRIGVLYI